MLTKLKEGDFVKCRGKGGDIYGTYFSCLGAGQSVIYALNKFITIDDLSGIDKSVSFNTTDSMLLPHYPVKVSATDIDILCERLAKLGRLDLLEKMGITSTEETVTVKVTNVPGYELLTRQEEK